MRTFPSTPTWLAIVALGCVTSGSAVAQDSGYASTYMRSLENRNSTKQYSTSRIQRQNINSAVSRSGVAGVNLRTYNDIGGLSTKQKPFANVHQGPSISPYLALSNPFTSSTDYYTIMKPLQEQRRQQERLAQQQYVQERKLNQLAAQGPFSLQGDEEGIPTGHAITRMYFSNFNTTGNYFPPPTPAKNSQ